MSVDAADLLEAIGLPNFPYKELVSKERRQRARARLSRTSAGSSLQAKSLSPSAPHGPRPWGFTVALVSPKPGVGRTTIARLMPEVLQAAGRTALVVGVDPERESASEPAAELGWALDEGRSIARFLASGAHQLPFGQMAPEELARLEERAAQDPAWLASRLSALEAACADLVFLDAPSRASPFSIQALLCADEAVVVLSPDLEAWGALPAVDALLARNLRGGRAAATFVINRFDGRRSLDREIRAALGDLAPCPSAVRVIQADAAVPQAGSHGQSLFVEAADSQAAGDIQALAEWLLHRRQQATGGQLSTSGPGSSWEGGPKA